MGEGHRAHPQEVHLPHRTRVPFPPLQLEVSALLALLSRVPTFLAVHDATAGERTFPVEKRQSSAHAAHSTAHPAFRGPPAGAGGQAALALWYPTRKPRGRSPRRAVPGEGSRGARVRTPGRGRSASPPPSSSALRPRTAPPGPTPPGKRKQRSVSRAVRDERRGSLRACLPACRRGCLSPAPPSPGGPSSPEEGTGTPPRSPRWPLRHEASARRAAAAAAAA